jgi:hypothetical protein
MKKYITLLAAGLILFPANLAYAEEAVEETEVVEGQVSGTVEEESGVWSVVDGGGNVVAATPCTESVCGEDGEFGGFLPDNFDICPGCRLVYQQPGYSGFTSGGNLDVEYNFETENYELTEPLMDNDQQVGEKKTFVPRGQSENANSSKIIKPNKIVEPEYSVDMEIATGFIDKDFNYIEIEVEQTDKEPKLLSYVNENDAIEKVEKDLVNEEAEESNILATIAQRITSFIKNIFGME